MAQDSVTVVFGIGRRTNDELKSGRIYIRGSSASAGVDKGRYESLTLRISHLATSEVINCVDLFVGIGNKS
jgi:hypothetical protein